MIRALAMAAAAAALAGCALGAPADPGADRRRDARDAAALDAGEVPEPQGGWTPRRGSLWDPSLGRGGADYDPTPTPAIDPREGDPTPTPAIDPRGDDPTPTPARAR